MYDFEAANHELKILSPTSMLLPVLSREVLLKSSRVLLYYIACQQFDEAFGDKSRGRE